PQIMQRTIPVVLRPPPLGPLPTVIPIPISMPGPAPLPSRGRPYPPYHPMLTEEPSMQRCAVIVDPLSTGQEYGPAFRAAGVEPVAVLASPEVPEVYTATWHPENFGTILRYDGGNLDELAGTLAGLQPLCVIAGAETGVELADRLGPLVSPWTGNLPV